MKGWRHHPGRVVWLGALAGLALFVVSGCGKEEARPAGRSVAAPSAAATVAKVAPVGTPSPLRQGPIAERLVQGLITIHDMPGGWKLSQDTGGAPEDTDLCGANLALIERQREKHGEVAVGFEQGASGPYFVETLAAYPPGLAQGVIDDLTAAVSSCREVTIRDQEGSLSVWQLAALPFPQLGDQSIAFREYLAVSNVEAVAVYIRRGDRIAVLLHVAIGSRVDPRQTESFARRADTRLAELRSER